MISTQEKSTCEKLKSFRSNIGKKEDTSANKMVTLTENNGLIFFSK